MKFLFTRFKHRRSIFFLALLGCLCLYLFYTLRQEPPLPPLAILTSGKFPVQKIPLPDRWMPTGARWGWLWHMKESLLGRAKPILFESTIFEFTDSPESALTNLGLGPPGLESTNGLQIWRIAPGAVKDLQNKLLRTSGSEVLRKPRIMTADGVQATLSTLGSGGVVGGGLDVDISPRVIRNSVDLSAIITLSAPVTNQPTAITGSSALVINFTTNTFVMAFRAQITNGGGVFLLDTAQPATPRRRIGVFITATLPPAKK